jgi:hypothetical protein
MGTEFRIHRERGFTAEDLAPLLASPHYRGFDAQYRLYAFGVAGHAHGREIPDYSVSFEDGDLAITAYQTAGGSWRELSQFVMRLKEEDASLRITSLEDDEDQTDYFR